jgi:Domain of unknown function (DUF1844)
VTGLWTPDGEHEPRADAAVDDGVDPELAEHLAAVQDELAATPVEVVVANHAIGLFQLAALHLNRTPPDLQAGRLAIDAMAALVEGLHGRLGEYEEQLLQGLADVRLAYVTLASRSSDEAS